jgi:PST family polysaccharide transporter
LNLLKEASVGIKWLAIARLSKQAFQFITLIILARLLTPDDFGLMTTALVVIGLLNIFRDMGLSAAIIQKKLVTDELLSSLFWLSIAIGIIATSSLIVVSPLIAGVYKTPKLA